MQSNAKPTPPVPSDLRWDRLPGFEAKKVKSYRPVPCLRCARIMATAKQPGHFCFGYSQPKKNDSQCAHCVLGGHPCERDERTIEDEFKCAEELSLACLHWAIAMDSDTPPTERPDVVAFAAEVFTKLEQQSEAAFCRQLGRKPGEIPHPLYESPPKKTCGQIAAEAAAAAADDTDSEPEVITRTRTASEEDDLVMGSIEM
ncbi:hypothetical protein AK830_g7705 [Neonectria ditissima]|uniref:Uncharacterized protein n=1 Tax=Neonectria ditissima TaxID=78410 RepID=A0A0P7BEL0_9HYPO|nr:hypothetical protein AK830_g7705 [Neonectria ditissima]